MIQNNTDWDLRLTSKRGWFELHLNEIWHYKDLLWIFVKRDFTTFYKQTILGPIWVWLVIKEQPSLETILGGSIIILTIAVHSFLALKKT